MAEQPPDNKKQSCSNLPRGVISLRGMPVSRTTRLPSIRSPRDLTLGAPPKRTFMPNIPVRREKKSQTLENVSHESMIKLEKNATPQVSERSRGRGRSKGQIIQTQNSIFSDGIATDTLSRKERTREAYQKSDSSAFSKGISIKKEKEDKDVASVSSKMDQLFRDDFIDDGDDDDDELLIKPVIFPPPASIKIDPKSEETDSNFNPDIAKEMGFDVHRVAKFIKKEKGTEVEDEIKSDRLSGLSSDDITNFLSTDQNTSKLVLLKLPQFLNVTEKMYESEPSDSQSSSRDSKVSDNQSGNLSSLKCLPDGYVGKLQVLKSGETRLLIGKVAYLLDSFNFLSKAKHEVVSITTDSSSGDICVLGSVENMMKFVPDEDKLLQS